MCVSPLPLCRKVGALLLVAASFCGLNAEEEADQHCGIDSIGPGEAALRRIAPGRLPIRVNDIVALADGSCFVELMGNEPEPFEGDACGILRKTRAAQTDTDVPV